MAINPNYLGFLGRWHANQADDLQGTIVHKYLFEQAETLYPAPMLRLVLIPSEDYLKKVLKIVYLENYPIIWAVWNPSMQNIDNFHLHYNKCKGGSFHSVQVSFVLPQEHCLGHNHSAALIDLVTVFM